MTAMESTASASIPAARTSEPMASQPGTTAPARFRPRLGTRTIASVPDATESRLGDSARTRWMTGYARAIAVSDALVAVLASWLALVASTSRPPHAAWIACLALVPAGWVGMLTLARSYELRFLDEGSDDYRRILDVGVKLMAFTGALALVTQLPLARSYTLVGFPVLVVGGMLTRSVGHHVQSRARRKGITVHRALVVGTERATAEMVRRLASRDDHSFTIVGALVDRSRHEVIEGVPVVGRGGDVRRALDAHDADTLIVAAWSTFSQQELRHLSWELEDSKVDILVTPNLTDVAGTRISVRPVVGLPLLHVERPEFTGIRRVAKGLFDRLMATLALIVLSPVILGLAIAVRLDSRGPAFYRQTRVGRGGRQFRMVKLRTMHVGSDDLIADLRDSNDHGDGPLFKMKHDPRITRVGSALRRTSLDELPQLWNVLLGTMSLVGPRPPLPDEVAQYGDDVHRRLLVKPGMTGLWQVSGRSDLGWEESVRLDLYYVENWNFLLDLSIISQTFRAVVAARGAY